MTVNTKRFNFFSINLLIFLYFFSSCEAIVMILNRNKGLELATIEPKFVFHTLPAWLAVVGGTFFNWFLAGGLSKLERITLVKWCFSRKINKNTCQSMQTLRKERVKQRGKCLRRYMYCYSFHTKNLKRLYCYNPWNWKKSLRVWMLVIREPFGL